MIFRMQVSSLSSSTTKRNLPPRTCQLLPDQARSKAPISRKALFLATEVRRPAESNGLIINLSGVSLNFRNPLNGDLFILHWCGSQPVSLCQTLEKTNSDVQLCGLCLQEAVRSLLQEKMPAEGQSIVLPQEIWQNITSHLTVREWAAACGTCRSLLSLQLDTVHLLGDIQSAGGSYLKRLLASMHSCRVL
jgi:hypothetical protein